MNCKHLPIAAGLVLSLILSAALSACGSSGEAPANAKKVAFKLTDEGCEPHDAMAPAGPIAFELENAGTSKVTEMEVMEGDKVLGEEENVTDGLSGSFSATLDAGKYTIYCPGGSHDRGTLTVIGAKHVEGAATGKKDDDEGR